MKNIVIADKIKSLINPEKIKLIIFFILVISLPTLPNKSFGTGIITSITFSGPNDPNHQNVVQLTMQGGFNQGACDPSLAAIRNTPDRNDMISSILMAYAINQPISVTLNETDKYFGQRFTIERINFTK